MFHFKLDFEIIINCFRKQCLQFKRRLDIGFITSQLLEKHINHNLGKKHSNFLKSNSCKGPLNF